MKKRNKTIALIVIILIIPTIHILKEKTMPAQEIEEPINNEQDNENIQEPEPVEYIEEKTPEELELEADIARTMERVVATYSPEKRLAFQFGASTIIDDFIYIGTGTTVIDELEEDGYDPSKHQEYINNDIHNYFYKFDLDLNVVWQYDLGDTAVIGSASPDSKGNIYFVTMSYDFSEAEYLTIIELVSLTMDGEFRWKNKISYDGEKWDQSMINVAVDMDDIIYVGDSKFFAFDSDGNTIWEYPTDDKVITGQRSSPIIDAEGNIYFMSPEPKDYKQYHYDIKVFKFAPNGELLWSSFLDNNIELDPVKGTKGIGGSPESRVYSTPVFLKDGKSFYATIVNVINKVDSETGEILWSVTPKDAVGYFKASPAVDENDVLYVGTKANKNSVFYAVNPDGTTKWINPLNGDMYDSPVLGDDNKVYIGTETTPLGKLYALDKQTGEIIWVIGKRVFPDFTIGSIALRNGHIYFGCNQGNEGDNSDMSLWKVRIDAENYLPGAASPRFHRSNENTGRI